MKAMHAADLSLCQEGERKREKLLGAPWASNVRNPSLAPARCSSRTHLKCQPGSFFQEYLHAKARRWDFPPSLVRLVLVGFLMNNLHWPDSKCRLSDTFGQSTGIVQRGLLHKKKADRELLATLQGSTRHLCVPLHPSSSCCPPPWPKAMWLGVCMWSQDQHQLFTSITPAAYGLYFLFQLTRHKDNVWLLRYNICPESITASWNPAYLSLLIKKNQLKKNI